MNKIKKISAFLMLGFAVATVSLANIPSKAPTVANAEESNVLVEDPPVSKERIKAIIDSGTFFNLNYTIAYNYINCNEDVYRVIQNGAISFYTVLEKTQDNKPVGTKNPTYVSPFINSVLEDVFTNNIPMEQILGVLAKGADDDNTLLAVVGYMNVYIPRFLTDMINSILTVEGSTYKEEDLMDFDFLKLREDNEPSLSLLPKPTEKRLTAMTESGGFYNIHYLLIDLYLKGQFVISDFSLNTHYLFKKVVKAGMIEKRYGEKLPEYNNEEIAKLIKLSLAAQPKIYEALGFYMQATMIFGDDILWKIYFEKYIPVYLDGLRRAIDQTKQLEGCPEILTDFENYDIEVPAPTPEETPAKVPYYWIIVAGVGAVCLTSVVFILIGLKKKKRNKATN